MSSSEQNKLTLRSYAISIVAFLFMATLAWSQDATPAAPQLGTPNPNATEPPPAGTGPYSALMEEDSSLAAHTVYHPQVLDKFGSKEKLPIAVWGNGGCSNMGNSSRNFLTEIASHGYLVIASGAIGKLRGGPPPGGPPPGQGGGRGSGAVGPPPGAPGTQNLSKTAQLTEAIDWAVGQNSQKGSKYEGKLDVAKVAVMGTSCGGLQALEIAGDPRVKTTVLWSSGILDQPRAGANATKASLQQIHGPVAYFSGGTSDIATPMTKSDFADLNNVPVFWGDLDGVGHAGPLNKPNGGEWGPVGVAWLDWQLKGKKEASKMFTGKSCGLCTNSAWKVEKKKID